MSAEPSALELRGITKRFRGVVANEAVDFDVKRGEIHALLGENGAGKTTLMNVAYGLCRPDDGRVLLRGRPVTLESSRDAIRLGIGMVHQHFMLIPDFTVAENVTLGNEVVRGWFLDRREASRRIRDLSNRHGLAVDPDARVRNLSVGPQQRVEIVKALFRRADILILDEPTAVLTPQEVRELLQTLRELAARGVAIVLITHKLKEVLEIADRITVLRRGQAIRTVRPRETDEAELAALMVGREVALTVAKGQSRPAEEALAVEGLRVLDDRGVAAVDGASFSVRGGEILGIAGVQGNGQTELVEALTGLRLPAAGRVRLLGEDITRALPRARIEAGIGHIPEDRQKHGLVLPFSIADNLVLCSFYQRPFARGLARDYAAVDRNAQERVRDFDIRTPSVLEPAESLSGGNQQKVIAARELSRPLRVLVANQPTRGLDVGSIEQIHLHLVKMRDRGCAVLLVSAELDELVSLSDRIAVLYKGRIVDTLDAVRATREELGLRMAGVA